MSLFHPHLAAVGEWEAASASTEMLQRCTTVTASVKSDLIERYFTLFHYSEGSSVQKDTLQQRNNQGIEGFRLAARRRKLFSISGIRKRIIKTRSGNFH